MSEDEFFRSTPSKLFKQLAIHTEFHNQKGDSQQSKPVEEVYIDSISI